MRLPCVAAFALALGLGSCGTGSFGVPAGRFDFPQVARAYIPLHSGGLFSSRDGAAVVIAPGVAVTNAHNANIVDPKSIMGTVPGYDILYFRSDKIATLPAAVAFPGEAVIAYGQGENGLRVSRGTIRQMWPAAFGLICDAGPGFSGGPVIDAKSGALVGITYGYEGDEGAKMRLLLAYRVEFVLAKQPAKGRRDEMR